MTFTKGRALQLMILAYVLAAEATVALLLTIPAPKAIKSNFCFLAHGIWKPDHRLTCRGGGCFALERDRIEKMIYNAERNVFLYTTGCQKKEEEEMNNKQVLKTMVEDENGCIVIAPVQVVLPQVTSGVVRGSTANPVVRESTENPIVFLAQSDVIPPKGCDTVTVLADAV